MMKITNETMHQLYDDFDSRTDVLIEELRKEDHNNGYQFDMKLSGYGLAIGAEAVTALSSALLIMRGTRMDCGESSEDVARTICTVSRLLNSLVMQYVDICGLDHEVLTDMESDEAKKLTQGNLQDAASLIDRYFKSYGKLYPDKVNDDTTFADILYTNSKIIEL